MQIERDKPILNEKLEQYKKDLQEILISEDLYLQLRNIPRERRSLKEEVWVKVFELTQKYHKDLEKARRDADNVKENLMVITESLQKERKEADY